MIIHQTTNKSCVIFAVGSLTVKHMIVDLAIKNFPVTAKRLVAGAGSVSAPRHCDAPRASKGPRGGMACLRGQSESKNKFRGLQKSLRRLVSASEQEGAKALISVTFPDGASRPFEPGVSGIARDGILHDLADPLTSDARIEFVARDDPRALELVRHDAAHVLAEAVQTLFTATQAPLGPVIENGFYSDFYRAGPSTPQDFPAIEKRTAEIIARDKPFTKEI